VQRDGNGHRLTQVARGSKGDAKEQRLHKPEQRDAAISFDVEPREKRCGHERRQDPPPQNSLGSRPQGSAK